MMQTALYPGSFDPPTLGHYDIICRAAKLVDRLLVGVAQRETKHTFLAVDEKVRLLRIMTSHLPTVEIVAYSGLTVEFAAANNVSLLVRGLRVTTSVEDEFQIALANRSLANLETIFVLGDERLGHISSTIIREIARAGGSLKGFVTPEVEGTMKSLSGHAPPKM